MCIVTASEGDFQPLGSKMAPLMDMFSQIVKWCFNILNKMIQTLDYSLIEAVNNN